LDQPGFCYLGAPHLEIYTRPTIKRQRHSSEYLHRDRSQAAQSPRFSLQLIQSLPLPR
jgi:hypothetical protein